MIEHTLDTGHSILYLRPKSALEQNARCIIAFARYHRAYAGSRGRFAKSIPPCQNPARAGWRS
jgi:hypothetical protein